MPLSSWVRIMEETPLTLPIADAFSRRRIFHMYTIRPMKALRMFHAAGSSLQLLISTSADENEQASHINSSLFWACYKSERSALLSICYTSSG